MNRFCSMFSQILKLIPRVEFETLVHQSGAQRHARGLACWDQFVAMLFCQLGRAQSLREICQGLQSCEGKLRHLDASAPRRSSLSYANAHRPWERYQRVFVGLLGRIRDELPGHSKFRFKHKRISMASTIIDLCGQMFDWAKFRRTKGAIKLHLLLDHDGYLPCFALITEGKTHDLNVARRLRFAPDTLLVFDRGYNDFKLFGSWCAEQVYFVTRMKDDTAYRVLEQREPPTQGHVVRDQIIELSSHSGQRDCPHRLRRVEVYSEQRATTLVFLTNQLKLSANTIAAIYQDRWQIELLFKALKQNLRIKTFVGTSPNAVKTQIWSALIALLMVRFLQLKSRFGWSLSNLVALLRMNLFTYRDLWAWLDAPFGTPATDNEPPPAPEPVRQAALTLR